MRSSQFSIESPDGVFSEEERRCPRLAIARRPRGRSVPAILALLSSLLVISAGCGSGRGRPDRPATVPARGVVTYKGEPVGDAVLVLQPSAPKGYAASATTNTDGTFDLKAFPPDSGAVPGSCGVVIMKVSQEDVVFEGGRRGSVPQPKSLIPVKYTNPAKSGLTVEVPAAGTETLRFELAD